MSRTSYCRLRRPRHTDWTRSTDWGRELELREERHQWIKAQLLEGKTVAYRQSGWSLYPRVYSNDLCCYLPVRLKTKEWSDQFSCWVYWISNLKGRLNGWCYIQHIHGKLS